MNTTRQLSERITDAIENIPNGFRAIDRDRLLNDIRDLYDAVLDMEPSVDSVAQSPVTEAVIPVPVVAPVPEPIVKVAPESPAEVVAEVETPSPEPGLSELPIEAEPQQENNLDEGTLAGKLNQKPISDLRSGIPLNEKFGFIQNLFQNNASDYGDAIMKMNNSEDQEIALTYFDKVAGKKGWDFENTQVKTLRSYIERRHLMVSEANADQ
ncbi:MAG: hypothetical protein ACI85F_002946 [Bacteroidia bacterium]|jgi:hypothetical protein